MAHPEPEYTLEQLQAEPRAEFASFTRDDATRLGETTVAVIRERGLNLAVDVHIGEELAYRAQLGTTGQFNAEVIAGKRLVVKKFGHSSLLARFRKEADPALAEGLGEEYKFWGGSIPIFVGGELVATLSSSGEADVVDHETIAEALRRFQA
ncbi:MAG TPA: heme-binding protein [Gryllotalpicola sp.]